MKLMMYQVAQPILKSAEQIIEIKSMRFHLHATIIAYLGFVFSFKNLFVCAVIAG